ncbi:hypothetical protein GON01_02335 [Sphingomonas sp. MAH-20]|uniref:Glycosyltransferase family 1 protein n=1 Tax=Sphingomonas horti TaxID=2682842 RepID=A0A6I4IXC2_9SPHN|nr:MULTISPECIES: hypothetical protein [Sphingomonas]MBA2920527.1 hypothetical protein [Sphingomonas sp. CGMCC 1.13658]MVO76779.1 hypothetical protein [Sphingomonas horti]
MRILFYLPVVTPWWFEHILVPMIDAAGRAAEVHILAPEPWSGTGIGNEQLARASNLPDVHWHIIGGPDHQSLRTAPRNPQPLIDFVGQIAPDHVICRSADRETPRHFPGRVHYLMEGGVAPFQLPATLVWLADDLFDHGVMPTLEAGHRDELAAWLAPAWERHRSSNAAEPAVDPAGGGEPRITILMPLEYEHPENFFLMHRPGPTPNSRLVAELAAQLPDHVRLMVTDHPLNHLHVDRRELHETVAGLQGRVSLLDKGLSTMAVARSCDGMIVGDSKAFGIAAFWGKPLCRSTRFRSAGWLDAYGDVGAFVDDLGAGRARAPCPDDALFFAAYHLANNAFDPQAPDFDAETLFERLERAVDSSRWQAGMARAERAMGGLQ